MRIKEVEDLVGITRKNIRFYEKEGLLSPSREEENSYRDYSNADVERLKLIKLFRKLDMPLSSISDLLEERISLKESLHLHELLLKEKSISITNAKRVCEMIDSSSSSLKDIDVDLFIKEIESAEENSTVLVNIVENDIKNDLRSKFQEALISCIIVAAVLLFFAITLFYFYGRGIMSKPVLIAFVVLIFLVVVGFVVALVSRIREIKNGEEDDLNKY